MKFTDWLWTIWGLVFPVLGLIYFNGIGLVVGIVLFVIYVWLIRLNNKSKKELQEGVDRTVDKLDKGTKKMEGMTERINADTARRKAAREAKKEAKRKTKREA